MPVPDPTPRERAATRPRRGRTPVLVAATVLFAVALVGAAAYEPLTVWWHQLRHEDVPVSDIGAPADVCGEVITRPVAPGSREHVPAGTEVSYRYSPPAAATHWAVWASRGRTFYTARDRPPLGTLVHNLEHGYVLLWYDETVAQDAEAVQALRTLASRYASVDDPMVRFAVVPWTSADGAPFPRGHIALTHWSVSGGRSGDQPVGVWQYCSEVSGAAVARFVEEHPASDSPEPLAGVSLR